MAWTKDINAYPLEMYAIAEGVLTTRKPCTLSFAKRTDAIKVRAKFYGLRHALREAPEHPLSSEAAKLTFALEGVLQGPCVLTILHADESVEAVALRGAIGLEAA